MENNTNNEVELQSLQKQIDELQKKIAEEKPKWYKNPSVVLSILALTSSLIFSTRSIYENYSQKKETRESSALATIKSSIEELVEEEDKYMKFTANPANDMSSKTNAGLAFQTKTGNIIDKISKIVNANNINQIEPNLLLNYGRYLLIKNRFKDAKEVLENAISRSTDSLTIGICYRTLANIYSNPSNPECDSFKSRSCRRADINIGYAFHGDARYDYLSRSYELWSMDEYYFIKNASFGNQLIDSARYFTNMFADINMNKRPMLNRLNEIYNFYNRYLITNNLDGEYSFSSSDGKSGVANIIANTNGIFLNIDYLNGNELYGTLKGPGNIIDFSHVKFSVTVESNLNGTQSIKTGSLNLETAKDYKLTGSFYEVGKKPVVYTLTKKMS